MDVITTMEPDLPPEPPAPPRIRLDMLIAGLATPPLILLVPLWLRDPVGMFLLTLLSIPIGWAVFGLAISARYRGISLFALLLAYPVAELLSCALFVTVATLGRGQLL